MITIRLNRPMRLGEAGNLIRAHLREIGITDTWLAQGSVIVVLGTFYVQPRSEARDIIMQRSRAHLEMGVEVIDVSEIDAPNRH